MARTASDTRERRRSQPTVERVAYTIDESCVALGGMSRVTVYRMIRRGELRSVMVGGRRLVPVSEIDRLLAG